MKRSKYSEEQIAYALREADGGTPVGDVCRRLGISEATIYVWKKKFAHLGLCARGAARFHATRQTHGQRTH
jgi:putative transposase